jgi:hypothetical protein
MMVRRGTASMVARHFRSWRSIPAAATTREAAETREGSCAATLYASFYGSLHLHTRYYELFTAASRP